MQEDEQVRAHWRLRQRGAVPDGTVPMPMLPVAQMPRADPARLARMAELAVAETGSRRQSGADSPGRAQTRRAAHWTQTPTGRPCGAKTREFGAFSGAFGRFRGAGAAEKAPWGEFSPANKGIRTV